MLNSVFELQELGLRPEASLWQNVVRLCFHCSVRFQKKRRKRLKQEMWEGTWKPLVQMKTGSQIAEVFQKMFLKSQQVTLQIGAGWCVDILWISTFPSIFSILFGFPMQPKMCPTLVLVAVSASLDLCLHLSRRSRGHFLSPPFSPYLFSRCRFAPGGLRWRILSLMR